jgi:hypothetical protein
MKRIGLNLISSFLLLAITIYTVGWTACTKEQTVRAFADYNARLATLTNEFTKSVERAYEQGRITKAQRQKLGGSLSKLATAGKTFTNFLEQVKAESGDKVTKSDLMTLDIKFLQGVVKPFLDAVSEVGLVNKDASDYLYTAILALKAVVAQIAGYLGRGSASEKELQAQSKLLEVYS